MKRIVSIQIPEDKMGTTLFIEQHPGSDYEFRVYYTYACRRNKYHLQSFGTFKEAFDHIVGQVNDFYR